MKEMFVGKEDGGEELGNAELGGEAVEGPMCRRGSTRGRETLQLKS